MVTIDSNPETGEVCALLPSDVAQINTSIQVVYSSTVV